MQDKAAIIIIVWNRHDLVSRQMELLKLFCKDNYDIIIVDNSTDLAVAEIIKKHTNNADCKYIKTHTNHSTSLSHAFACNHAYNLFKSEYEYMLFLDHDIFPIKDFSVKAVLNNRIIGGIGQTKIDKTYVWPGCVLINNKLIQQNLVDFSTNSQFELDTGGNLYKIVEKYGFSNCIFFDQFEVENTLYDKYDYHFFTVVSSQSGEHSFSFMHFLNASNWNNSQYNEERISSLLKVLNNYVNAEITK